MSELPMQRPGAAVSWLRLLRRRRLVGILVFTIVAGVAAAIVLLSRPIWRVSSSLRLGAASPLGGVALGNNSPTGLFSLFQQITGDPFANEQELLASRTVVEGVVLDNALNVRLVAPPGWYRDSLVERIAAGRDTRAATYAVAWRADGRVSVRRTRPAAGVAAVFAAGKPAAFGDIVVWFRPWRVGMPREVELQTRPFGEAVRRTSSQIHAERTRRDANLVRIRYDDPDPGLALAVVAAAIQRYSALRASLARRESGETVDSLGVVVQQTLAELTAAETGLERFEREHRLVSPDAQSRAFIEQHSDVATELAKTRLELDGVDDVLRRLGAASGADAGWPGLAAHPTFLANETLGSMLTSLVALQQQRIELASRRTENSRTLHTLDQQIVYLDGSLRALVRDYRAAIAQRLASLEARSQQFDTLLASAPAAIIELGRRERRVRQLSEVYLFADQRRRQEALRNAVGFAAVQVVDPPEVQFQPVWPRPKLGLGVGLLCALGAALLGMVVTERADRSIRLGSELARLIGAPLLAAVETKAGRIRSGGGVGGTILRRVAECGEVHTVLVTPVGTDPGAARIVAEWLRELNAPAVPAARSALPAPLPLPPASIPVRYAGTTEIAAQTDEDAVVLLVARQGATRAAEAVRAGRMLRCYGARPCGVVMLCGDARQLEDAWA